MSSAFKRIARDILFPDRDQHPIPVMDGHLSPNDGLARCSDLSTFEDAPDDVAFDPAGAWYVSVGCTVMRSRSTNPLNWEPFCTFPDQAGGLCAHPNGRLLVCVSGEGLAAVSPDGTTTWLKEVDGVPIACPTAVTAASDGTVYLTQGSATTLPQDWSTDLLSRNTSGRLIRCDGDLSHAVTLLGGLAYPYGCALSDDETKLVFTESWAHTVSSYDISRGSTEKIVRNLPGYPARISACDGADYWLAIFGMRTHLLELVLDDVPFRTEMMRLIEPAHWIAPALRATGSYLEPLQGGGIRKLGIVKPWAPPRAYGLVARIDSSGDVIGSLHSRVGGGCHGVTAARQSGRQLIIVSKGHRRLVASDVDGSR